MNGKSISKLKIGDKASFSKTITETDVVNYAGITGDFNPAHMNDTFAKETIFGERIAHGMLSTGLISAVLGTQLPGPGAIYISQEIKFTAPVKINDTIKAEVEVIGKDINKNRVTFKTVCINQYNKKVIIGEAVLMPPKNN